MISKELVHAALSGERTGRTACGPIACHFCARHVGIPFRDYTLDAATLAASVIRYYREFRPDAVWISADTWITAEAMGASVLFPGEDEPMCGSPEPTVRSVQDVRRIRDPDPATLGRQPLMIEAVHRVVDAIGDEVFVVACFDQSPFSLACALGGITNMMIAAREAPELVRALMDKGAEHSVAYGRALAAAGPDMLSTGDSPAGLLGPDLYRELALPYERRLFEALQEDTDCWLSLHICGDSTGILEGMAGSGADVLELDHDVDLAHACAALPEEVAIWGNINPVSPLYDGTPEQVRAAAEQALAKIRGGGRSRFVLSTGCTVAPDTPGENLRELISVAGSSMSAEE